MPQLSTFTRRLRAFLGLPHDNGHFTCHPENLKKGERLKVPGVVKRDAQDRSYVDWSESAWQEVDRDGFLDLEKGLTGETHFADVQRKNIDSRLSEVEEKVWRAANAAEGDEMALSISLAEDVWHLLTVDLSIAKLLLLEATVELCMIVFFAMLMFVVDIAESFTDDQTKAELFRSKLMLSLTAVRLSTDSIFGWTGRRASSGIEVAILALQGWFHWLLLSIAGAVIVARALKPLRQVIFAPDACLSDQDLSVRMQVIRHSTVTLYNLQFTMNLVAKGGKAWTLPVSVPTLARWTSAMPLTIKHEIDENSPLHPSRGLLQYLMYIRVSMSATDNHGIPVNAGIVYYDPDSFFVQRPAFSRAFAKQGYLFPRLLRGKKFCDQMRMFRDEQMNMIKPETLPMLICDLDNMPRTKVDEKATEALAPYRHSNAVNKVVTFEGKRPE